MGDMDSAGNSGSLQSSSGGDEDYESSRGCAVADSFSSFFNHQSYPHAANVTSFNPPPPPAPPSFFDPLANYLDQLSRSTNPNPVLNPDPVWPKDTLIRSDHLTPSSTGPTGGFSTSQPSSSAGADRQPNQISVNGGVRNPRKRTRASRRAPTTVLTTDTTNFRAMVQEFTGIPAPPFGSGGDSSSSLFFPRARLDLFGGRMNAPGPSTPLPPYLLRPLAQKIPPPLVSTVTTTNKNRSDVITASSSSGGNYRIPSSDLGLLTNFSFASTSSSSLLPRYPSDNPDPGSSKPGSGGSLELPITTTARNDDVQDQLGVLTASVDTVHSSSGKNNGGQLGWAEGLGLGAPAHPNRSLNGSSVNNGPRHSHQRPQNLGFAHQQIG